MDLRQGLAVVEDAIAHYRDTAADGDICQRRAIGEGILSNLCDRTGHHHLLHLVAASEGVRQNCLCAIGHLVVGGVHVGVIGELGSVLAEEYAVDGGIGGIVLGHDKFCEVLTGIEDVAAQRLEYAREGDVLQPRTRERAGTQRGDALGHDERGEAGAALEGALPNGLDARTQLYRRERGAAVEHIRSERGDRVRDDHAVEERAVHEGIVADGLERLGQCDAGHVLTTPEGVLPDGRERGWQLHLLDIQAVPERTVGERCHAFGHLCDGRLGIGIGQQLLAVLAHEESVDGGVLGVVGVDGEGLQSLAGIEGIVGD